MTNFLDLFHLYLIPFAIAVPIALFVIYLGTRHVAGRQMDEREIEERAREKLRLEEIRAEQFREEKRRAEEAQAEARRQQDAAQEARRAAEQREAGLQPEASAAQARRDAEPARYPPPVDITVPEADDRAAVLLVDDSAVSRAKLRKLFEAAGYRVQTAGDGIEALEVVQGGWFSVVVTDLEMPNMDGFQLIASLQGSMETEDLPIIAITGHDEMQARVHDMKGLYGIFKKPWNDRELLKRVQALSTMRGRAA